MQTIIVNKNDLLEILQKNKDNHIATFKLAIKGYREDLKNALSERISKVDNLNNDVDVLKIEPMPFLPVPVSHENDYDQIIGMLNLHVHETIELTSHEYSMYVQDLWNWSGHDGLTNIGYSKRFR